MSLLSSPTGHLVNLSTVAADTQSDIAPGETIEGSIDSPDDVDRFRLRVTEPGTFTFTLSSDSPGVKVSLLDYRGHVLAVAETEAAGEQDDAGSVLASAETAGPGLTVTAGSNRCTDQCIMQVLVGWGSYFIKVARTGEFIKPLLWTLALHHPAAGQEDSVRLTPGAPLEGRRRCLAILEPGESREVYLANFVESPVEFRALRFGPLGEVPAGLLVNLDRATGRLTISAPKGAYLGIYRFGLQVDDVETSAVFVAKVNVSATPRVRPGQTRLRQYLRKCGGSNLTKSWA